MKNLILILILFLRLTALAQQADTLQTKLDSVNLSTVTHPTNSQGIGTRDTLSFNGQLSAFVLFKLNENGPFIGGRYLPQLNYGINTSNHGKWDMELSLNIYGIADFSILKDPETDDAFKLYRGWIRYSGEQYEVRLGLQKINFGSASMIRPLMWFDRIDPRDPLQLTDGVWGVLGRYYFLNNVNLWAWTLYGNEQPSVWEVVKTNEHIPEFGGRIQFPFYTGELGITYHHRTADSRHLADLLQVTDWNLARIPENKFGIDGKWDVEAGLWFEASWTTKTKDLDIFTNQQLINIGADYTFGIGNGLNAVIEHLTATNSRKAFDFYRPSNFTALSCSYPFGITDNISAIIYYDWPNEKFYNFINWKKQLNSFSFYAICFFNPETNVLPMSKDVYNMMGGTGLQIMVVYNH